MAVTQKDIAARLGVTQTLVAKALRDHPRVAESTRQRVRELAAEMGYSSSSNAGARALVGRRYGHSERTGTVAVLYRAGFMDQPVRAFPYFHEFFAAIESECKRCGWDAIFMPFRQQGLQRIVREGIVDGALLLAADPSEVLLQHLQVPHVLLNDYIGAASSIRVDSYTGMRALVGHLGELGHRAIGYLGHGDDFMISHERLAGFRAGLRSLGVVPDDAHLETTIDSPNLANVTAGLDRLLARHPHGLSAITCYNDFIAMQVITVLQDRGFRVPGDVSVAGFDDTSVQSGFGLPVTTVHFDRHAMVARGIALLDTLIETRQQNSPTPVHHELFDVELRVRASSGPVAERLLLRSGATGQVTGIIPEEKE